MLALSYTEAVRLNYYALVVSILGECIPETAFEKLQSYKPGNVKNQLTDDDYRDMIKLREQGLFYKDLSEIYYLDKATIHRNLKRFKERDLKKNVEVELC